MLVLLPVQVHQRQVIKHPSGEEVNRQKTFFEKESNHTHTAFSGCVIIIFTVGVHHHTMQKRVFVMGMLWRLSVGFGVLSGLRHFLSL